MLRCSECLIPNTRPDTEFVDGKCSACRNFAARSAVDWTLRKTELARIIDSVQRAGNSDYDCIVPSSGGKDSTYQVITLLELGARPLVVTAGTCHLTKLGRKNIDNLKRFATTIELTPETATRAKLNRHGLRSVGDISFPEHMAIFAAPFRIAAALEVPLIFYGESPQREYGCPSGAEEAMTMTRRWVNEFGGLLGMRAMDCVGIEGITEHDMVPYMLPSDFMLEGITAYFLGQFIPWDSRRNAAVAKANGFEDGLPSLANWWPAENLDNAQTGLHDHMMYRKYGYGRMAAQLSVDIRNGLITRKDAMDLVMMRDGLFPRVYADVSFEEMCDRIEIQPGEVMEIMHQFTDWSLFSHEEFGRPILKRDYAGPTPLHVAIGASV